MFEDLKAELGKAEAAVRSAFAEPKAAAAKQRTVIQTLDAELLGAFQRLEGEAKKAEGTIHAKLTELRSAAERLAT